MKIRFMCMDCLIATGAPESVATLELRSDGRYEYACLKGHRSVAVVQEQPFEFLFELGAHAVLDGYYREAVSGFTASLERFYEFYCLAICLKRDIARNDFVSTWTTLSSNSERELGAFVLSYLLENGTPPKLLGEKWRAFRNGVIHKGKIPSRQEAVRYGQAVLDLICPTLRELRTKCGDAVGRTVFYHIERAHEATPKEIPRGVVSLNTILNIAKGEQPESKNLEVELICLGKNKDRFLN
ncbi:MAG: hypothetical protein AABY65_10730 [Nitrospirota bacterium]